MTFFGITVSASGTAGAQHMTKRDTLAAELSFELPKQIELNVPFDMVFRVTVHDSVPHANDSLDEIDIMIPKGCEILTGEPFWKGILSRGCTVSVRLRARITEPMLAVFHGYVYSGYVPQHMNLYHTVNSLASNEFLVIDKTKSSRENLAALPQMSPARKRCLVSPPNDQMGLSESAPVRLIPIEIVSNAEYVEGVCQLDRSAINALCFWLRKTPSSPATRIAPQRWQLSCPLYDMVVNPDSTATLLVDPMVDTATLSVQLEGVHYQVRLRAVTSAPETSGR